MTKEQRAGKRRKARIDKAEKAVKDAEQDVKKLVDDVAETEKRIEKDREQAASFKQAAKDGVNKLKQLRRQHGRAIRTEKRKAAAPAAARRRQSVARAPTHIQKLLFAKSRWTPISIRLWVARQPASRHLTAAKIDDLDRDYHVRQRAPEDFVRGSFRTAALAPHRDRVEGRPAPGPRLRRRRPARPVENLEAERPLMARLRIKPPSPVFSGAELRRELAADAKRKQQEKIKRLRKDVASARANLVEATRKARSDCVAELRAKLERLNKQMADAREALRKARTETGATKIRSCSIEAGRVRAEKQKDLEKKRGELQEEVSFRAHERRWRGGRPSRAKRATFRQETDEEVIGNLEAEEPALVPVFKRHRRSIKGTRTISRTEAMLHWAEEHPDELRAERQRFVPSDDEFAREMAEHYGAF